MCVCPTLGLNLLQNKGLASLLNLGGKRIEKKKYKSYILLHWLSSHIIIILLLINEGKRLLQFMGTKE